MIHLYSYLPTVLLSLPFSLPSVGAFSLRMMAGGGPPEYTKRPATLASNAEVGRASRMLRLRCVDNEPFAYAPGHVLALEMLEDGTEDEWSVGPYTVSRCDGDARTLDVCYRVVGKKTEAFAAADESSKWRFGGKFKVPIRRGVSDKADRVVGVSTGVGIGPLLGFAEEALEEGEPYRIDLFALFREEADVALRENLDALAEKYPDKFSWTPILSKDRDLVSSLSPLVTPTTHFHLIGNGSMVNEWTSGLKKGGVDEDLVTTEMYFNHRSEPRPEVVDVIAEAVRVNVIDPALN